MARFVVDTHALLWFLTGDSKLGQDAQSALSSAESELFIPAIALAESLWIIGKLQTSVTANDVLRAVKTDHRIAIISLTAEIVEKAHLLASVSEMHDRQIVATAHKLEDLLGKVSVITKDADICASGTVTTTW